MAELRGTWFVLPTAFRDDGGLDLESQARLVKGAIGWGVDGFLAMGVMGEASSLTDEERRHVLRAVFEAAGGTPVAVGCTAASGTLALSLIAEARDLGAVAAMVAPPPVRNLDLLPSYYARLARKGGLPLIIQDHPGSSGVVMPVSILAGCMDASGANVIKLEDPPTPPKISRLLAERPAALVFGGLGGVVAYTELLRGACGTMTGFAFPEVLRGVRELLEGGRRRDAALLFDRYLPLIEFEAQAIVGLAIRKEILRRRSALASPVTRGVVPRIDSQTSEELSDLLDRLSLRASPEAIEVAAPVPT